MNNRKPIIIVGVVSLFIALFLAFNSIRYLLAVYSGLFQQLGLLKTVICCLFTIEIGLFGVGLLFVPIINLFVDKYNIKKLILLNSAALLGNVLVIGIGFPAWNGIILIILSKIMSS
jgi:hypothetical protein